MIRRQLRGLLSSRSLLFLLAITFILTAGPLFIWQLSTTDRDNVFREYVAWTQLIQAVLAYPRPFAGSFQDLHLPTSWSLYNQRYKPYEYAKAGDPEFDDLGNPNIQDDIDWRSLQLDCLRRNSDRLPDVDRIIVEPKEPIFRLIPSNETPASSTGTSQLKRTGRTAIVLRAYTGFEWEAEDILHVRALITETSLRTGAEYQVVLLCDIHHDNLQSIFHSPEMYKEAMKRSGIPPEFRSITVLWDEQLLRNWYSKVQEHSTFYQVYQPLQLFALHHPLFDHYWQLELDTRFLGDVGQYLDSLSRFARQEPRKQALERSTFFHMQDEIGTYHDLMKSVDRVAEGGSFAWGPISNPDIDPIGPQPPIQDPRHDDFRWGAGEDADLIVTSLCMNASNAPHWYFKDWIQGFTQGNQTVRFLCPPAITRTSRALLFAMHDAQFRKGLALPSEASPISFALYHGLKISFPPQPLYWHVQHDAETRRRWWKGGPAASLRGVGPRSTEHPSGDGLSFWWASAWPRAIMDAWKNGNSSNEDLPWVLKKHGDKVYAPNILLHPVKHAKKVIVKL